MISCIVAPRPSSAQTLDGFVPAVGAARDVVVDGTSNLAYVASAEFGLAIVDVHNPGQPVAIGGANPPFYGSQVAVAGSLAVVSGGSLGMRVVDVSVPSTPRTVGFLGGTIAGVARSGQYAYILLSVAGNPSHTDLAVVDLSNHASPVIVGRVTLAGGTGIKVVGSRAYVSAGSSGLQIIDVSAPDAPRIVGTVDTPGGAKGLTINNGYVYIADTTFLKVVDLQAQRIVGSLPMTNASAVAAAGNRVYVLDGTQLKIVDITLPIAPVQLHAGDNQGAQGVDATGSLAFLASPQTDAASGQGGLYIVDATVPTSPTVLANLYGGFGSSGVAVSGTLAVASGGSLGMKVVDVSVTAAPRSVGFLSGTIGGVARDGQYAYALLSVPGNPAHTDLAVVDLSHPATPTISGRVTLGGGSGIKVASGLAYVAAGSAGLQIIDISNPGTPRIITTPLIASGARDVAVSSGYAYVVLSSAVKVVDVRTPSNPAIVGSVPMTNASAVAYAAGRLYVLDSGQFDVVDVATPDMPAVLSASDAFGAQGLDASGNRAFLARPATDHSDPAGGLYVLDVSNPAQPQLVTQIIVPGMIRAVAATTSAVYAGDSASVIDAVGITASLPTSTPTTAVPAATATRTPTPTSTNAVNSPTPTATSSTSTTTPGTSTPAPSGTPGSPQVGSFRCYSARIKDPFVPVAGVSLVDPFGTLVRTVQNPVKVCNSASVNGTDPTAISQPVHLVGHRLHARRGTPKFAALVGQQLVNEFGTVVVDVIKLSRLLVPSAQSLSAPPPQPTPGALNHFNCYRVKVTDGPEILAPITSEDQFGMATVHVKKPTMLCVPVNVNNEEPGTDTDPNLLMCYVVKALKGSPRFRKVTPVFVANEFGPHTLGVPAPQELCVPTRMSP